MAPENREEGRGEESGDRKEKKNRPIQGEKQRAKSERERERQRKRKVSEVEDRSGKDTKTEKNGETPREKEEDRGEG